MNAGPVGGTLDLAPNATTPVEIPALFHASAALPSECAGLDFERTLVTLTAQVVG